MVTVTCPLCVSEGGLKVTVEFGGRPVRPKFTGPAGGLLPMLTWNVNVPELPAGTVTVAFDVRFISRLAMVAVSVAVLLPRLFSLMPNKLAVFASIPGALAATVVLSVIGG